MSFILISFENFEKFAFGRIFQLKVKKSILRKCRKFLLSMKFVKILENALHFWDTKNRKRFFRVSEHAQKFHYVFINWNF